MSAAIISGGLRLRPVFLYRQTSRTCCLDCNGTFQASLSPVCFRFGFLLSLTGYSCNSARGCSYLCRQEMLRRKMV